MDEDVRHLLSRLVMERMQIKSKLNLLSYFFTKRQIGSFK
jgi:hypothetical protein